MTPSQVERIAKLEADSENNSAALKELSARIDTKFGKVFDKLDDISQSFAQQPGKCMVAMRSEIDKRLNSRRKWLGLYLGCPVVLVAVIEICRHLIK